MNFKTFTLFSLAILLNVLTVFANIDSSDSIKFDNTARNETNCSSNLKFSVIGGLKIGGASPFSMPAEIRKINKYNLQAPFLIGARIGYSFNEKWGVITGITFEGKGMDTKATVKDYKTSFNAGDNASQNLRGYYTGDVTTTVANLYLSIPVMVSFKLSDYWSLQAGPYVGFAVRKQFVGQAENGYLRRELPTGERVDIDIAKYDFSKSIRSIDIGFGVGANYKISKKFFALAQFDCGFSNIMQTDFETISFGLHNIYLNLGIGYRLF